jgi:hypothetical protein
MDLKLILSIYSASFLFFGIKMALWTNTSARFLLFEYRIFISWGISVGTGSDIEHGVIV